MEKSPLVGFKKIFKYAGAYRKKIYTAVGLIFLSVLAGLCSYVCSYFMIKSFTSGQEIDLKHIALSVLLKLTASRKWFMVNNVIYHL